jgi:lysozyme
MEISTRAGLALIKQFEGFRTDAYPDPATGAAPWTIGYGFTKGVKRGDKITLADADARLKREYDEFEAGVKKLVKVPLSPNQLGALVCFAFNVGLGNLRDSTLLKLVNGGRFPEAALQFARWNKAAGKVMAGLTKRRAAEAALFASSIK